MGMTINEQTAQLILDAIAWCNRDWIEALGWDNMNQNDELQQARSDFTRFCEVRGISDVERIIHQ